MEVLLLTGSIFAVILLAYRLCRSERPSGTPGLGLFSYKETLARPAAPKARRDA